MSDIKSLFSRYVALTKENKANQEAFKEDKKTLDEDLKSEGISGNTKKAFLLLVKEATMDSEQKMNQSDINDEVERMRSELGSELD